MAEGSRYRRAQDGPSRQAEEPADFDEAAPMTAEEKVALVLEAAAVPEAELGAFLRRKGVHEAQHAEWREQVTQLAVAGLRGPSKRDRKAASVEARRVRDLERELQRKEKALAEAAALLVLKKKSRRSGGTRTTTRTRGTTNDS